MKKKWAWLAWLLALALVLGGCSLERIAGLLNGGQAGHTAFSEMKYERPDMAKFEDSLRTACENAAGEDLDGLLDAIYDFYDLYDWYYTCFQLANIHYSGDLTDLYWEKEYNFCGEQTAAWDAGLDSLYRALAASPLREALEDEEYYGQDFFADYEGESIWNETLTSLLEREAALQGQYYALAGEAQALEYGSDAYFSQYAPAMAELLAEMVKVRQETAAYLGYDSFPAYAYEAYYGRSYSPQAAEAYLLTIADAMVDLYERVNRSDAWDGGYGYCSEGDTLRYVRDLAGKMGGGVEEAFDVMERWGLYDIQPGANKYDAAFTTYLYSYGEPYIFVNPYGEQVDKLTFAHEFGHFCGNYLCGGSVMGMDVAEVQSQAMEYLSLCLLENAPLERYKLADCLSTYVEEAAYALFELRLYALEGEDLTAENVQALYAQTGREYGFESWGWDSRDFMVNTHVFVAPCYHISYVVSNDVAFQIYMLEKQTPGAGVEKYRQCLTSDAASLEDFAAEYGLGSPFAPGQVEAVAALLEKMLAETAEY